MCIITLFALSQVPILFLKKLLKKFSCLNIKAFRNFSIEAKLLRSFCPLVPPFVTALLMAVYTLLYMLMVNLEKDPKRFVYQNYITWIFQMESP